MAWIPSGGSGGGGGGGSFVWNPSEWPSLDDVVGVGKDTAITEAVYFDMATWDGGQALDSYTELSTGGVRLRVAANNTNFAGISLGDFVSADRPQAGAVRIYPYMVGSGTGDMNDTVTASWGIYVFDGLSTSSGDYVAAGFGRLGDNAATKTTWYRALTLGGRSTTATFSNTLATDYAAPRLGQGVDFYYKMDASRNVTIAIGSPGGGIEQLWEFTTFGSETDTRFVLAMHSGTADLTVGCDAIAIQPPASFTDFPQVT